MSRKWHYLRRNKSSKLPRDILFIDTETSQRELDINRTMHTMKLGWTCYCQKEKPGGYAYTQQWEFWTDREALNNYIHKLCQSTRLLHIICSNVVFDLASIGFFKYFPAFGYNYEFAFEKGMSFIMSIEKDKHRIKALSIQNWFPVGVEKLGELLGLSKMSVDFDTVNDNDLAEYCRRDTEIIVNTMLEYMAFIHKHDMGNFKPTRASQSFTAYRHKFPYEKLLFHAEESGEVVERLSYYGGKCEAFYIGKYEKGEYILLDINSMYPYIMRNKRVPVRFINYVEFPEESYLRECLETYCVCAEVDLDTETPAYAVKHNNRTLFPVGCFTTGLCTEGLKYAYENRDVHRVRRACIYIGDVIFREFVDYFYSLKVKYEKDNNPLYVEIAKRTMNSLYGKFGQQKDITVQKEKVPQSELYRRKYYDLDKGTVGIEQAIFGEYRRFEGKEDTPNTFTAIPAHITEYGRFLLWRIIQMVGRERAFYCDTDSIMIHERDLWRIEPLLSDNKLGYLKEELRASSIEIRGAKDYKFGEREKLKGVKKGALQIGDTTFIQEEWYSLTGLLGLGINDGFIVEKREKSLKRKYNKGIVTESGYVEPFTFGAFAPLLSADFLPLRYALHSPEEAAHTP